MKTHSLLSPVAALTLLIAASGFASASIVSRTFTGVTDFNIADGAVTEEFPVGTVWKAEVEWESTSAPLFINETQAQYRLKKFSLSFQGASGKWSTSSKTDNAAFTINHVFGGTQHELQFNSGWGPAAHSNPTIENFQPFSINIVFKDPTGKAIPDLTSAPSSINFAAWSSTDSYFKLYLNNEGNRFITGRLDFPAAKEAEISVQQPGGSQLVDGTSRNTFGTVKVGSKSTTRTYTIRNTGKAPLTNLAITTSGLGKKDFIIGSLSSKTLAPGAKARFTVVFKPKAKGKRSASLQIASNDKDENPFDIQLSGNGK